MPTIPRKTIGRDLSGTRGTFARSYTMTDKFIQALDQRTKLVKEVLAKESAEQDAKTARLRALRLAREKAEAWAGSGLDQAQ